MERIFRDYLRKSLKNWIKVNAPFMKLSKLRLGFPFEGSVIWQCDAADEKQVYLILQFNTNRDQVQLHLAWEKSGVDPDYELVHETYATFKAFEKEAQADPLAAVLSATEHGWATGDMVCGKLEYEMSGPVPPEEKLREMFEGEATRDKAAATLLAPHHTDWRTAKLYHTWDMVSCFLEITESDCAVALDGTLAALTSAIKTCYFPRIALLRTAGSGDKT